MGDLHLAPRGAEVRDAVIRADRKFIPEARAVFANSATVARRLKEYCGLDSTPLYHPPRNADRFYCADAHDYLLFPSRIAAMKRQSLVIEALPLTREQVCVRFLGPSDHESYLRSLQSRARELGVESRVQWLGEVDEEAKLRQYAYSLGVIFPPVDEDYGYITLEAMLSGKPVITCTDSGGPLEFVRDGQTGLVAEPTPEALAAAMDAMWADRGKACAMGEAGRDLFKSMDISWETVVKRLLA
jgi:glycosyltransferase involved in cell wall biosynthesis